MMYVFFFFFASAVTTSGGTATINSDYTDGSGSITFTQYDAAVKKTIMLSSDVTLEDIEYFTFVISVTDPTTLMTSLVSGHANTVKVFILDTSSK